jgi:hypothetical protein
MSIGAGTQRAANPKLPLWNATCLSYSTWLHHFADVLRISWLWIALVGLTSWLQWSWLGGAIANVTQGVPLQAPSLESRALIYIGGVAWFVASISINVAWYRRIILGEQPRLSGSNLITGSLWRYVGVGILITLVACLPALLIFLLLTTLVLPIASALGARGFLFGSIFALVMIGLYLAAIAVVLRLSPLLPARAAGDLDRTFGETWRQTRGNTWRLFWGLMACAFLPMIVVQIAVVIIFGLPNVQLLGSSVFTTRLGITNVINVICYMLTTPISANFLALAYLHFFNRHQIEVFD